MRQDQFTTRFQELLGEAQSMAVERSQQYIDPLHLLLAVLKDTEGTGRTLLERSGVRVRELERKVKEAIGKLPEVSGAADNVQISRELMAILNSMEREAERLGDKFISTDLFLLALCDSKCDAAHLAQEEGLNKPSLENAILSVRGGEKVDNPEAENNREALKKYTVDLTEKAKEGKLDPVIGRDDEIRRAMQILQRRSKNNPVLIGDRCDDLGRVQKVHRKRSRSGTSFPESDRQRTERRRHDCYSARSAGKVRSSSWCRNYRPGDCGCC